jgi:hypothetical protein
MARHYKDLIAWQKAMDLVNTVYEVTDAFPKQEIYSLTDQMWSAAISFPGNSPKDRHITVTASFSTFFAIRVALWRSLKPSYLSLREEITCRVGGEGDLETSQ